MHVVPGISVVWILLASTVSATSAVLSAASCLFPVAFRNQRYYSNLMSDVAFHYVYKARGIDQYTTTPTSNIVMPDVYRCLEGAQPGAWFVYYVQFLTLETYDCERALLGQQGIAMIRTTNGLPPADVPQGLPQCTAILDSTNRASVLLPVPYNFSATTCPFDSPPDGATWQLTFEEANGGVQCVNDPHSTAVLQGNELHLQSCYQFHTIYTKPFHATLQCIDTFLSSTLGMTHPDNVVILADIRTTPPSFYCARYNQTGATFRLSLYVGNPDRLDCLVDADSQTASQDFVVFTMGGFSTSTETPTTTVRHPNGTAYHSYQTTQRSTAMTSVRDSTSPDYMTSTLETQASGIDSRKSTVAIAVVCSIIALGIIIAIVAWCILRRRLKKKTEIVYANDGLTYATLGSQVIRGWVPKPYPPDNRQVATGSQLPYSRGGVNDYVLVHSTMSPPHTDRVSLVGTMTHDDRSSSASMALY